ncbi:MAG: hypothetical protein K0R09_1323 [Clostridiales bacterium]|jgi:hypothetical protein|nr:hypothetical protein [Clostridiales bacterium]
MSKQIIIKVCCLFLIIFSLDSCKGDPITEPKMTENNSTQTQTLESSTTPVKPAFPQYFFFYGTLMGGFVDNEWKSICSTDEQNADATDFYVKDILAQDKYYIYQHRKSVGVSNQVLWATTEDGLGSFEGDEVSKKLAKYSEFYNTTEGYSGFDRTFNLPVKVGEELSDLKIPDYSFSTEFVVDNKVIFEYELATNRDIQPFPRRINDSLEATDEGIQALIDLFGENQMENTAPNFTKCLKSDFDNDGNEEYLMLADSCQSELGYPLLSGNGKMDRLGIFSAIFYQEDDGSIQTLYSDLRPYKGDFKADKDKNMELMGPDYSTRIDLLTVADLNSDGVYEIGVKKSEWENGFYLTYAINGKGEYEVVMRSNWGM